MDELTDRFWAEFPDGTVPIRHFAAASIDPTEDFFGWAAEITARADLTAALPMGKLRDSYESYWDAERRFRGGAGIAALLESRRAILNCFACGLTFAQTSLFLDVPLISLLNRLRQRPDTTAEMAAAYAAVSEVIVSQADMTALRQVAAEGGLNSEKLRTVLSWYGRGEE